MNSVNKKTRVNNTQMVILASIGAATSLFLSNEANRFASTALYNLIGRNAENLHMFTTYISSFISFAVGIIITVIFGAFVCKEKSDWLKFIVSTISGQSLGNCVVGLTLAISFLFIKEPFLPENTHISNFIATVSLLVFSALFTAVIISAFIKSAEKKADALPATDIEAENAPVVTVDEIEKSPKSRGISIVLCIFLGWLGIHRFYTGKVATGILWLFTGGLFGIGILVDLVMLLFKAYTDSDGLLIE